jgi:transcription initiation factor TFIIE subunit alpha
MATPKGKVKKKKRKVKVSASWKKLMKVMARRGARRSAAKKPNMDIVVKRNSYSKSVRAAVLVNAAARQKLIEMGGENTIDVIREFDRDMSDEELAKKTGIKPSEVRVVLNRLHNRGVFAYTRVRDRDSGWYSYIWRMDEARLREVGCGDGEEVVLVVGKEGYCCPNCGPENLVDFPEAVDLQFRCGNCGQSLEYVSNRYENRYEK